MGERAGAASEGKLLLVSNTSWYLWNFRRRLAERLEACGYEVAFAAPPDDYSARLENVTSFAPLPLDRRGRNPLVELAAVFRLWRLLHRVRPDAVLSWTPKPNIYGALAGRVFGVPVIPNVAGLGFAFIGGGWLARVAGSLYRFAFRKCAIVFFQNAHDRDQFVAAGRVREHVARLLPGSGVDLERFRQRPPRRAGDFVFLFVGRLLADKGLRELVAAARLCMGDDAPVRLRIAGFVDQGNPAAIGEDEIRGWQAEGVAEYVGSTDAPEKLIADADCVVLPSYYREGIPRVLLEAAACGRPVITTDAPGCRDAVIDGETGFLCQPRGVDSLVQAMRKMLTLPPAEREAMGRAGRAFMERSFSEEIVFEAYEKALTDVLGPFHGVEA